MKPALANLEVETLVWGISVRPGKPFYFGIKDSKLVFGLPGNPVSSLVCFQLFVRPALLKTMGHGEAAWETIVAKLDAPVARDQKRTTFARGNFSIREDCFEVSPSCAQESYMQSGLAGSNALIKISAGEGSLLEGEMVDVLPIRWDA